MRYNLTDLKLFVAVTDAGSVSRGAQACFLSPSSASLRIKALEESLGVPLFLREPRGVALTRAGQIMLEHCRRCLAELEQMHASLAPYAHGVKTQVTVFANSTAIASFLPGDLQVFLRLHPDARIQLEERLSRDIVTAVADGRADLGVVTWNEPHPLLEFRDYRADELVAIAPRDNPLAQQRRVSFDECLRHPFICLHNGAAILTFLIGKAALLGRALDIRVQVASFPAVLALVESGAGISIVPHSVLRHQHHSALAVMALDENWAQRSLSVCVRREDARLSHPAQALLTLLTRESRQAS